MNQLCTIVISSCDAYSDLWRPFFTLMQRQWADCPFPIILGSNHLVFEDPSVKTICVGDEKNWSNSTLIQLEQIKTTYVLMLLDDFFIEQNVDNESVMAALDFAQRCEAHLVRLHTNPPPDRPTTHSAFGEITLNAPYRVSTQAAIWQRTSLIALLKKGESIWSFEIEGTQRSRTIFENGFYGSWQSIITYSHVVERGKWMPRAIKKYENMAIGCDFSARPTFEGKDLWLFRATRLKAEIVKRLPKTIHEGLKKMLKKV